MKRRELCKKAAAGVVGGALVGTGVGSAEIDRDEVGLVSTLDHFHIGDFKNVWLSPDVSKYEYDIIEPVAGFNYGPSPKEVAIFVHGWLANAEDAETEMEAVTDALRNNGYQSPVIGYEWDALRADWFDDWWPSSEIAERNGKKLGRFIADYREINPDTTIRLIGHSLGGKLALESLDQLNSWNWHQKVDDVVLMGATVADKSVQRRVGKYETCIAQQSGWTHNFYSPNDQTLPKFEDLEGETPVGAQGVESEEDKLDNYQDIEVGNMTDHLQYYQPQTGCVDQAIQQWTQKGGGDDGQERITLTRSENGRLAQDRMVRYKYKARTIPDEIILETSGTPPRDVDIDLYITLDGRNPDRSDYDRKSRNYGPNERIELRRGDVGPRTELGILVHCYFGRGQFTLDITETGIKRQRK